MISPVFVLCSALLITGTLADSKYFSDAKQYGEALTKGGMALMADMFSGKDMQKALADRGLEAAASLSDELSSAAKSALKRVKEIQNGGSYEEAISKAAQAILNKGAGKFDKVGDFVKLVGEENLKTILAGGAKAFAKLMGKN